MTYSVNVYACSDMDLHDTHSQVQSNWPQFTLMSYVTPVSY